MNSAAAADSGAEGSRDVRPIGDGVGMDKDGSAESGRTRLARGTTPHAPQGETEHADGASASTSANAAGPAAVATRGGEAPDGSAGGAGSSVPRGIDARGSGPVLVGRAPGGAARAPAQSICEAVEQLIEAKEADEAIAEWMQGGG